MRYQQSKLANLLFAYELGEVAKKAGSKVKVCGVVAYLEKGGTGKEGQTTPTLERLARGNLA